MDCILHGRIKGVVIDLELWLGSYRANVMNVPETIQIFPIK